MSKATVGGGKAKTKTVYIEGAWEPVVVTLVLQEGSRLSWSGWVLYSAAGDMGAATIIVKWPGRSVRRLYRELAQKLAERMARKVG